jgi:hypothetical protein
LSPTRTAPVDPAGDEDGELVAGDGELVVDDCVGDGELLVGEGDLVVGDGAGDVVVDDDTELVAGAGELLVGDGDGAEPLVRSEYELTTKFCAAPAVEQISQP